MYSPPPAVRQPAHAKSAAGTSRSRPRRAHERTGKSLAASPRRLFFGLWPQADVLAALSGWVIALPAAQRTPAGQLHLTVLFLGAVPAAMLPKLITAAAQVQAAPVDQPIDRLEYWAAPKVLCAVGPTSAPLAALRAQLLGAAETAGVKPPDATRPLLAHVTLARRRHTSPPEPGPRAAVNLAATSFSLIESRPRAEDGERYVSLADWPLLPRGPAAAAPVLE